MSLERFCRGVTATLVRLVAEQAHRIAATGVQCDLRGLRIRVTLNRRDLGISSGPRNQVDRRRGEVNHAQSEAGPGDRR
jgi:hypothetical protein